MSFFKRLTLLLKGHFPQVIKAFPKIVMIITQKGNISFCGVKDGLF